MRRQRILGGGSPQYFILQSTFTFEVTALPRTHPQGRDVGAGNCQETSMHADGLDY